MKCKLIKTVILKTVPVMTGYLVLGFGFGILSESAGYGVWWALAMSVFIYAGSMQYLLVSLLSSGASLISTALATLMVNARHLFYGISMIDRYKDAGAKKPYLIFALTDETYSLVCDGDVPEGVDPHLYYFLVSLCDQIYWIAGSAAGALAGSALTFDPAGIDFAMTALFVTVFVEQWLTAKNHVPALVGVGLTVVCLVIFGEDLFLIPSMALILACLSLGRGALEKGSPAEEKGAPEAGTPIPDRGMLEKGSPAEKRGAPEAGTPIPDRSALEKGSPAEGCGTVAPVSREMEQSAPNAAGLSERELVAPNAVGLSDREQSAPCAGGVPQGNGAADSGKDGKKGGNRT